MDDRSGAYAVCVDCIIADANGPDAEGIDATWPGFDEWTADYVLGPVECGQVAGEYCEGHYSTSPCQTCATPYTGDRFHYYAVKK